VIRALSQGDGIGEMTIRERLHRRKRSIWIVVLLGATVAWVGFAFAKKGPMIGALALLSFFASFIALGYGQYFAFRCPDCGGGLGHIVMDSSLVPINSRIRFCPYCGLDLDVEEIKKPAENSGWD
jgi:hypothetical protein